MKIETRETSTLAYLRRVGPYGVGNQALMTRFKALLAAEKELVPQSGILGIALDNPAQTAPDQQRYDVGVLVKGDLTLPRCFSSRELAGGTYAVFEVAHTVAAVSAFWQEFTTLTQGLPVDWEQPVIERYDLAKLKAHRCEFCVPLLS